LICNHNENKPDDTFAVDSIPVVDPHKLPCLEIPEGKNTSSYLFVEIFDIDVSLKSSVSANVNFGASNEPSISEANASCENALQKYQKLELLHQL
jgi:hypothetical protein